MSNDYSFVEEQARATAWQVGELLHRTVGSRIGTRHDHLDESPQLSEGRPNAFDSSENSCLVPIPGVTNPVFTAGDVTDFGDVYFVADPFLIEGRDGTIHSFFEVFNPERTPTAAIGHASSETGYEWAYDRIVLEASTHLSFPYVFQHDGSYYMVPDKWNGGDGGPIDLYRAETFPGEWSQVATLVDPDSPLHDFVVVQCQDRWWGIAGDGSDLSVFHSRELERDRWTAHSSNPVVTDRPRAGRPGGRPLVDADSILLFLQDCESEYGSKVRGFRVTTLSEDSYEDEELESSPLLEPTGDLFGWNSGRMHHIDPLHTDDGWLCAVDGNVGLKRWIFGKYHWSIGLYTLCPQRTGESMSDASNGVSRMSLGGKEPTNRRSR